MRKNVHLQLVGPLQDAEGHVTVQMRGATLSGTPLQVAVMFEALSTLPESPDVANDEEAIKLQACDAVLKSVREGKRNVDEEGYDIDPDA